MKQFIWLKKQNRMFFNNFFFQKKNDQKAMFTHIFFIYEGLKIGIFNLCFINFLWPRVIKFASCYVLRI